ncbi:MAG: hypothetical protein IJ733_10985, partial [Lachnospiraceae bacterium]|nr:hypothetical protein [Lachnospiraceae bacterium]
MRKKILKKLKKAVSGAVLALAVTVTGVQMPGILGNGTMGLQKAKAATETNRVPMVCYTRYSGNLNTYTTSSLTTRTGYICSYDQCTILNVYSNGAV